MSIKPFVWSSIIVIVLLGSALLLQNNQMKFHREIDYSQVSVIEDVLHQDTFMQYTLYDITFYDEYLCGTVETTHSTTYAPSMVAAVKSFPDYKLQKTEENQQHIFMIQNHEDFHPDMTDNLYISLNTKNELVLYHGDKNPEEPQKVFFPIEKEAIEHWIPIEQVQRLQEGIPIDNVGDYNSVLSTYNEYSIEFPYHYPE